MSSPEPKTIVVDKIVTPPESGLYVSVVSVTILGDYQTPGRPPSVLGGFDIHDWVFRALAGEDAVLGKRYTLSVVPL